MRFALGFDLSVMKYVEGFFAIYFALRLATGTIYIQRSRQSGRYVRDTAWFRFRTGPVIEWSVGSFGFRRNSA